MTPDDITEELAGWSDHVLNWLLREEETSPAFRRALVDELARREAKGLGQPPLVLTRDGLHAMGAINARQAALLGLAWPPKTGWLERLIGTEVPASLYARLLAARGKRPAGMSKREWINGG